MSFDDPALHARFATGLRRSPEGTALRLCTESYTYAEIHRTASLWAGALRRLDGGAAVVGVLAGKSIEGYAGILAGLYAGATVVPLNPAFPAARTRRILQLAGVTALISDVRGAACLTDVLCADPAAGEDAAPGPDPGLPVLVATGTSLPEAIRRVPVDAAHALAQPCPVRAEDTAYILFTSGSTGKPKGVPIAHGSTKHYFDLLDERYDFGPDDVFTQTFDLNFDCGMFDMFCAWGAGATVCDVPMQAYRDMPAFLAEQGITVWFSTPSAIALLRKLGGLGEGALPGLRWSFFAGEALRAVDVQAWLAAAPATTLENIYGPTELTVTITGHGWTADSPQLCVNGLVPIGRVHPGHDSLLLASDGSFVETGGAAAVEGELCITGPQLTRGYLDPADDAGRFLDHDGRRWYRTGDRVRRMGDGELIYLGRVDSQVQVLGVRVELAEIDHALRACEGVDDAVTVTRETDIGVELVVFYTGRPTAPTLLSRQLREVLPENMLPRDYRHLFEFPLNSNRKVDRPSLSTTAEE